MSGCTVQTPVHERAVSAGIEARDLKPVHADFNLDLCRLGAAGMRAHLAGQLAPADRARFAGEHRLSVPAST